jgi:hypothetical protein
LRGGLAAAGIAGLALITASALMLLAGLMIAIDDVHDRVQAASPTLGAGVGITLLCLCYLPNALVAAVSWLAGPGLSIGPAAASPLFTAPGLLPPIPLLAAMPTARPPSWTMVVFTLPMLAGLLAGLRCRVVDEHPLCRLSAVAVASFTAAVGFGAGACLVSGRLAAGPFDPIDLRPLGLVVALLGWVGVPAAAVVLWPISARRWRTCELGKASDPTGGNVVPSTAGEELDENAPPVPEPALGHGAARGRPDRGADHSLRASQRSGHDVAGDDEHAEFA